MQQATLADQAAVHDIIIELIMPTAVAAAAASAAQITLCQQLLLTSTFAYKHSLPLQAMSILHNGPHWTMSINPDQSSEDTSQVRADLVCEQDEGVRFLLTPASYFSPGPTALVLFASFRCHVHALLARRGVQRRYHARCCSHLHLDLHANIVCHTAQFYFTLWLATTYIRSV